MCKSLSFLGTSLFLVQVAALPWHTASPYWDWLPDWDWLTDAVFPWPTTDWLPEDYQLRTAREKQALLYDKCVASNDVQGTPPSVSDFVRLLFRPLGPVFEHGEDERPWAWTLIKPIHSVGYVTKAKFEAVENPFTGVFQGAPYVLMRLSLAEQPGDEGTTPGVAIKFLRNNMRSGNLFAMFSLEGQNETNFFEHDFASHVDPATSDRVGHLVKKFRLTTPFTSFLGASDLASFNIEGKKIQDPVFPFLVVLKPNPDLNMTVDKLPSVEPNTMLYEVWAQREPEDEALIKLGKLTTTSEIVGTLDGDQKLFFQHQKMEDDITLKPEWREYLSDEALMKCPYTN